MSLPEDIRPDYYGGADNPYEVIKVAEAWGWGYQACMMTALKYIARCGKKEGADPVKDLTKARFYIDRARKNMPGSIRAGQGVNSSIRVAEFCAAHGITAMELREAIKYLRQNDPETALVFISSALEYLCGA